MALIGCLLVSAENQEPLTLDSCLVRALRNNVEVRNAALEVEAAQQLKKSLVSKYFPNVSAIGFSYHAVNPIVEMGIDDIGNAHIRNVLENLYAQYGAFLGIDKNISLMQHGTILGVSAIQPVYAGGRIVHGNQLAKVGVEAAELQQEMKKQEVLLQTEESYWQIISLKSKQTTVAEAEALLESLYHDVKGAYDAGLVKKSDLLMVSMKQNEMRSNRIKVENGIRLATMALCQSIGMEYNDSIEIVGSLDSLPAPDDMWISPDEAVAQRNESNLLDLSVKAEKLQGKLEMGKALPQVAIGAGYAYTDMPFDRFAHNGAVFATVQIPLTAWWETSHTIKLHKAKQRIAENNRDDLKAKMELQTRLAWNELTEAYTQLEVADESIAQAQENLTYCENHYNAGLISMSELLQAQTALKQVMDQKTDYAITYQIKLTHYKQLTGQNKASETEQQ